MEKVPGRFVEAKEKVKGKSRMEERKRWQRGLKRKRGCSEENGEPQRSCVGQRGESAIIRVLK